MRPLLVRFPVVREVEKSFVEEAVVEKRFVVVALDEVLLPKSPLPKVKMVAKRFVEEAVVEKRLVVVALVPVALVKVRAWSVVEPET